MAITPVNPGQIQPPNSPNSIPKGEVSTPNLLVADTPGAVQPPNNEILPSGYGIFLTFDGDQFITLDNLRFLARI